MAPKGLNRYKYSALRRQITMEAAAQGGVLRPWMKKLALWWVDQVKTPTLDTAVTEAQRITAGNASKRAVTMLLQNPVWHAYVAQMEEEILARPRAIAESHMVEAVQAHFEAIDDLRANQKWDTLVKYTNPLLERVWPTSEGPKMPAQIIQITVGSPGSFAATHAKNGPVIEIANVEQVKETPA